MDRPNFKKESYTDQVGFHEFKSITLEKANRVFDEWWEKHEQEELRKFKDMCNQYQKRILEASDDGYKLGWDEGFAAGELSEIE